MFDLFLQVGFPLILFAPAVLSIFYIYYSKRKMQVVSFRALALVVCAVTAIVAGVGTILFRGAGDTEIMLSLPQMTENFEVSLNLATTCFFWILGACFLWSFQLVFWPKETFEGSQPMLRYLYWLGAFFAGLIVFLADQVVMGLIFAEMCLFLMHAFHLLDGGEEGRVARVSYFKRGALIFIGLFFLMIFYLVGLLSIDAIILFASSTYVMSLVLSRNSFYSWGKIVPNFYSTLITLFLFMRVLHPGLASEMWVPLSFLFTLLAVIFVSISLISLSSLSAYYWWAMGLICHFFAQQFGSGAPAGQSWLVLSIFFLLTICVISGLLEFVLTRNKDSRSGGLKVIVVILFMQLMGALPGLCSALEIGHPMNYEQFAHFILVLILSIALLKILFLSQANVKGGADLARQATSGLFAYAAILVVAQFIFLFLLGRSGRLGDAWMEMDPSKYFSTFISFGLVSLGGISGYFLAQNQKYLSYLRKRSLKIQEYLPGIDPIFLKLNLFLNSTPQLSSDFAFNWVVRFSDRVSHATSFAEEIFLQRAIWREGNAYLSAVSRYVRFFHRGSIRFYMFVAILFFIIWSAFLIFI